jgi:hypothetical protein
MHRGKNGLATRRCVREFSQSVSARQHHGGAGAEAGVHLKITPELDTLFGINDRLGIYALQDPREVGRTAAVMH